MNPGRRSVFPLLTYDIHCGSSKLSANSWSGQRSTLPSGLKSWNCYPQAGAYFSTLCPTINLSAWGSPPTELTTPSSPLWFHPHSSFICITFVLVKASPLSLSAHFGIVIKHDLKRHIFVSCQKLFPCYTFVYLFIHLKKLNYEWMSHWIIHEHPGVWNK